MLDVVYLRVVERRVVNQDLDGVCAPIDNALGAYMRKKIGQASGLRVVVTAGLIGEQQTGIGRALFGRWQTPLGIQQNGAGNAGSTRA